MTYRHSFSVRARVFSIIVSHGIPLIYIPPFCGYHYCRNAPEISGLHQAAALECVETGPVRDPFPAHLAGQTQRHRSSSLRLSARVLVLDLPWPRSDLVDLGRQRLYQAQSAAEEIRDGLAERAKKRFENSATCPSFGVSRHEGPLL